MSAATRDLIAIRGERVDGTGAHARALRAGFARALADRGARGRQLLRQRESAAVAVPQPVFAVDQHPERRRPQRLGASRPGRKRPIRRPAERIQNFGADEARDAVEVSAAPAIERIGAASRASGDCSKASQFRSPIMPTSTSVRNGASAPTRSASFSRNAPRGASPARSIARSIDASFEVASPRVSFIGRPFLASLLEHHYPRRQQSHDRFNQHFLVPLATSGEFIHRRV